MKKYNIYYNNKRINNKLLDISQIEDLKKRDFIFKKGKEDNNIKIDVAKIRIIECTIL